MHEGDHAEPARPCAVPPLLVALVASMHSGCLEPTPGFGEDLPGPAPGCGNAVVDDGEYCPGDERQVLLGEASPTLSLTRLQSEEQLDVLVGHTAGGATIYLGIGASFPTAVPLVRDGNATAVRFVDTDEDSLVDVVLAFQDSNVDDPMAPTEDRVVILRQISPAPEFQATQTLMIPTGPRSVITPDLDGNGLPDLVVACETAGAVAVLMANADGTFRAPVPYPAGVGPRSVAAADVNGDGRADLVVAPFAAGQIGVLLQTDAGFDLGIAVPVAAGPSVVTFADLNADEAADLVVGHDGVAEVWAFLAGGVETLGRFGPPVVSAASGPILDLTALDLQGDGAVDLLAAHGDAATIGRLTGVGDGSFTTAIIEATGSIHAVRSADANDDTMPDIVIAKTGPSGGLSILLTDP